MLMLLGRNNDFMSRQKGLHLSGVHISSTLFSKDGGKHTETHLGVWVTPHSRLRIKRSRTSSKGGNTATNLRMQQQHDILAVGERKTSCVSTFFDQLQASVSWIAQAALLSVFFLHLLFLFLVSFGVNIPCNVVVHGALLA